MTLGDKQRLFPRLVVELFLFAWSQGYEIKLDDAFRSPRAFFPYSKKNSCHKKRLALDLCLFRGGEYLTDSKSEDFKILGEFWEGLHPLCRNGRKWEDGGHFSMEHDGVK